MKFKLDELHKVESSSIVSLAYEASDTVQAIIKVKNTNYVPICVLLRASISPYIFTGEFKYNDLKLLEQDSKVESISINKKLSQ